MAAMVAIPANIEEWIIEHVCSLCLVSLYMMSLMELTTHYTDWTAKQTTSAHYRPESSAISSSQRTATTGCPDSMPPAGNGSRSTSIRRTICNWRG